MLLSTKLSTGSMSLTQTLNQAKSYKDIAEIIKTHLMNSIDCHDILYTKVKTNFLSGLGVTFNCCVLSNDVLISHNIKKAFCDLNTEVRINQNPFSKLGYKRHHVSLGVDSSFIPLVLHIIQNAKQVRTKQWSNLHVRDEALQQGLNFMKLDEELQILKKQLAARRKFLKTQAKKIEENYIKDNSIEITKEEEELYALAGESLQLIPLF